MGTTVKKRETNVDNRPFNVTSEIGNLKKVLLHRPGLEVENLTPELLDRLLFDDIPYLDIAQKEHDAFAKVLKDNGVEVVYLEDLAAETVEMSKVRSEFINQFLDDAGVRGESSREILKEYFADMDEETLIHTLIAGVRKKDIPDFSASSLSDKIDTNYPFALDPMPNLYFTRDPFATIGSGITLNNMRTQVRNRETIFAEFIFKYHPEFKEADIPYWFDRNQDSTSIEGGDELILNKHTLAIGISQRTDAESVETVAKRLLFNEEEPFERVLAFKIPEKRAFMHLDTVFTMIDYDKFTIHSGVEGPLKVYSMTAGKDGELNIVEEQDRLENILKKYLGLEDVTLIRCAGGDRIDAGREQWSDGSNTLAIAPGEVVVYSRNHKTNEVLREHGIKLHEIPSSELSRGRGGPRCMSMPLVRENL
ncbi:arginine deiminase [Sporohalobacter salinus]|uniref:arginine deiminase n=1 Tax=Sporohalobacter salinus TaxID=1494606 RepID=UPI00195F576E|nr:arginine deiminase [Sporohalobacter salinus]